ncbi:tRNA-splicing endonuclease subunit sen54 [Lecanora helva]
MVDLDEDIPSHSQHDFPDTDLTDEPQDFRFLAQFSSSSAHPTIPRRGEKDFEHHGTQSQASTLDASRDAMHNALSVPRTHNPRWLMVGYYDPDNKTTIVEQQRGSSLRNMGKADTHGRLSLLPEEALYLVERGTLQLQWRDEELKDLPLSLQAAYTYLLGDRGLTLERYIVYAGLKRSGYVVQRAPTWYPEDYDKGYIPPRQAEKGKPLGLWAELYNKLFETKAPERPAQGPLVVPGFYRSYAEIYRLLTLIPAHDPSLPTDRESQRSNASMGHPTSPTHPRIRCSFDVWKPNFDFKKSCPPPPDFHIAVIHARDQGFPVLEQLDDLLQSVPNNTPPTNTEGQLYRRLKHGYRHVLLAVVDQGVISYLRISDAGFGREKIYERGGRGRAGKRGGMRGGRGRGRGRGS